MKTIPATPTEPPAQDIAFQDAVTRHQRGELQDAEKSYRAILQTEPAHAKANHNLGALYVQLKQPEVALSYLMAALEADPAHGQYWLSYIDALYQAGQLEAARQVLDLARKQGLSGDEVDALAKCLEYGIEPVAEFQQIPNEAHPASSSSPQGSSHHDRPEPGSRDKSAGRSPPRHEKKPSQQEISSMLALFATGHYKEAEKLARSMTSRFPRHWTGWKMLGVLLNQRGRGAEALQPMQKAVELLPNDAEAHNNLGIVLQGLNRLEEAAVSYRQAIEAKPEYSQAHFNLGTALHSLDRLTEAEASYRRALQTQPDYAEACNNLGLVLHDMGRLDEADRCFHRAIEIRPNYPDALCNLGSVQNDMGHLLEAAANYRQVIKACPGYPQAHFNLGNTLQAQDRMAEAEACYRSALQFKPDYAEAYSNLGVIYHDIGSLDEAEACWRRALDIKPDYALAYSNLLFCLSQNATIDARSLFAEHCRFGDRFEAPFLADLPQFANPRIPDRELRIGLVSADLRSHAVASFIEPVLAQLSAYPQLTLHAYYNHTIHDAVSQRLQGYCAHWKQVAGMSDAALAELIRADKIDILIDLSGHANNNRLLTFARKPAPVQVSWMGYPGTTGLRGMDYYFADRFFLPAGQFDDQFTEKIVRLPANAPFLPSSYAPAVNALPASSNGFLTFGSFNRVSKLSRPVVALWSQLLNALPESRMVLGGMPEEGKYEFLIEWFAQYGIARERLDFHPRSTMDQYLKLHQQVDICLDTFPYNGGTTTLHALWMGVPTLTLAGGISAGRTGAAILGHAGLEAFAAHDAEDFVKKGVLWAGKLSELSAVRAGLRLCFANSAMGQPELVAAGLEQALRVIWQRWCAGLPTVSFEVNGNGITEAGLEAGK